jgi:hypothetical protein
MNRVRAPSHLSVKGPGQAHDRNQTGYLLRIFTFLSMGSLAQGPQLHRLKPPD